MTVVRVEHADGHPLGPGTSISEVDGIGPATVQVRPQRTAPGSHFEVTGGDDHLAARPGRLVWAFVYPTLRFECDQTVVSWNGGDEMALVVDPSGRATVRSVRGSLSIDTPLALHTWHLMVLRFAAESVVLEVRPIVNPYNGRFGPHYFDCGTETVDGEISYPEGGGGQVVRIGAGGTGPEITDAFTGKIGSVGIGLNGVDLDAIAIDPLSAAEGVLAHWIPLPGIDDPGRSMSDRGPGGNDAFSVNLPVGSVTGPHWSGASDRWSLDPGGYAALRYSAEALTDCLWEVASSLKLPDYLPSGVYALSVEAPGDRLLLTFVVRSASPEADVVLVLPTMSYMAEGGRRPGNVHPGVHTQVKAIPAAAYRDFGGSTLDVAADSAGISLASRLRPVAELKPLNRSPDLPIAGRLATDLSILAFLRSTGRSVDVITDEDLDRDGAGALSQYRVAVTGSYPAYASRAMLDAWETYSCRGGRIMYLGGGGFYWLASYNSDRSMVEVRRAESGSRPWQAEPGEYDHFLEDERCGLWRAKGRPPQKVFGVGMAAEGRSSGIPFSRMPDSFHRSVAWVFDGVHGEDVGAKALRPGGTAAMEVDRYDRLLGSPPHARILASAVGLSNDYMKVSEEILFNHPGLSGEEDHQVRADMVMFTTRNGGAVFSVGSSAWASGLPVDNFDNDAARVTGNVLDAFVARGRLRGSRFGDEDDLVGGRGWLSRFRRGTSVNGTG